MDKDKENEKIIIDLIQEDAGIPEGTEFKPIILEFSSKEADFIVKELLKKMPDVIRRNKDSDRGFEDRAYRRWKKPLDLTEALWEVSCELGTAFNQAERSSAAKNKDYKFEALVSLHARALLVAREILCLLYGGFADGALSRWRSLHELSVIALFLRDQDQDIAHRYLASSVFAAFRAAQQMNEYAQRSGLEPLETEKLNALKTRAEAFELRFGKEMHHEYGWAIPVLKSQRVSFAQLEKAVGLDHWRPRYRWASQHTHAGYRPAQALLGAAETVSPVFVVGKSDGGFTDPMHMMAISLNQVTTAMLLTRPNEDTLVQSLVLNKIASKIGRALMSVEKSPPKGTKVRRKSP